MNAGDPPECEDAVIAKIRIRREAGRRKYGTTMERLDLNRIQWLQHAQEEAMDLAIYLEKLIRDEQNATSSARAGIAPSLSIPPLSQAVIDHNRALDIERGENRDFA
jgi:hypothetical protein